jgi:hypothetical protein
MNVPDKWVVLTSCFFRDTRPIKFLLRSARIWGFEHMIRTYGRGELYENWTRMKVHRMIPVLEGFLAEGITHYLYTDGRDAFFLNAWDEIQDKWERMGRPDMLLSGQTDSFPIPTLGPYYPSTAKYKHHCPGGYMGRVDAWLETHRRFVRDDYESRKTGGDEAGVWQWAWVDGWFRPMIDEQCRIFQNLGGAGTDPQIRDGVLTNMHTGSFPSILHFTGCCKEARYGVYDDMKPWWDRLYPNHPIEREEIVAE